MIGKLIGWLCWRIVEMFPTRSRMVYIDGQRYLLRFYIKRNGLLPGMYLHHFYMGDSDRELHDHPWWISGSLILTGGYYEERLIPGTTTIVHRVIGPGTVNIIRGTDFHRVDLIEDHAWTLFVSGNRNKDWGFFIRETGQVIPHREYLLDKGRTLAEDEAH